MSTTTSSMGGIISICSKRKDLRTFSEVKRFFEVNRQAHNGLWRIELRTGFRFCPNRLQGR